MTLALPLPATRAASARGALAALSLSMLLASFGISGANVALPTLAQAFAADFAAVQWVVLSYLLATTTLVVGAGRLGDLFGRRRLLLAGIALFALGAGLSGLAPSLGLLIAARALQGLGGALMMALTLALVGESVPKERTGRAMGLLGTMSAAGTALGPSLGGLLVAEAGWRALFLTALPLGCLAFALAWRFLPRSQAPRRERFDLLGLGLLAAALAAYALALTPGRAGFGGQTLALLGGAALGGALFVMRSRRAPSPLVRLALLREPALAAGLAMSGLVSTVLMATLVVGPFHLSLALGLSASWVGLAMAVGPLVVALTSVPFGRLVDRLGPARALRAGLAILLLGCLLVAGLPSGLGVAGYVLPLALLTAGYALFQAANNTGVMAGADTARRGLVSGLLHLSRNLGLVTGAAGLGALFLLASGAADLAQAGPEAVAGATRATFAAALLPLAGALLLARWKLGR